MQQKNKYLSLSTLLLIFLICPFFYSNATTTVSVDSYGAIGDGIHDDTVAIQKAFDSGYPVHFSPNKTYRLISNGLYIRNNLEIIGNHATLLIDDSYAPTNSDFHKRIFRHSYNTHNEYLHISDLTIDVKITAQRYTDTYLCVFQPTYINNISLNNFNIYIHPSKNSITAFWMDHGCDSLIVNNCTFTNETTFDEGGVLWLMTSDDKLFQTYTSIKESTFTNCTFKGTCGDEIIALYGTHSINSVFDNCTIIGNNKSPNSTRPITVFSDGENVFFNVTFNNCDINCSYNTDIDNCEYNSLLGVGSQYNSNYFNVCFNNCNINALVSSCLLYPNLLQANITNITSFDFWNHNINIFFNNSNIFCNRPISGSRINFQQQMRNVLPMNFILSNCTVECSYAIALLTCINQNYKSYYYTPLIGLIDNTITLNDPIGGLIHKDFSNLKFVLLTSSTQNEQLPYDTVSSTSKAITYLTQKNSP